MASPHQTGDVLARMLPCKGCTYCSTHRHKYILRSLAGSACSLHIQDVLTRRQNAVLYKDQCLLAVIEHESIYVASPISWPLLGLTQLMQQDEVNAEQECKPCRQEPLNRLSMTCCPALLGWHCCTSYTQLLGAPRECCCCLKLLGKAVANGFSTGSRGF